MKKLENKIAIVTGGANGMGKAIVKKMAEISGQPVETFNKKTIIPGRTPVFIYRNEKSEITAFGICSDNAQVHGTSDWGKQRIEKAIAAYKTQTQIKGK